MMAHGPSIIRTAHGAAAAGGALLVAEQPPLDEYPPPDATRTEQGLALRRVRGRPFQPGNTAASGRGPSLTRIASPADAPEERRRRDRKATSLRQARLRELEVQYGGPLSTGVKAELKSWACALADAEVADREGDSVKATALREKASGFHLKAIGIAEREAAARPRAPVDPLAAWRLPEDTKEPTT